MTRIFVGGARDNPLDQAIERESGRLFAIGQIRAERPDGTAFTAYFNGLINAFMQLAIALGHRQVAIDMLETALGLLRSGDDLRRPERLH